MTDSEPDWEYAIDHHRYFETRHEAIGAAVVINAYRDRFASGVGTRVAVFPYPVCSCDTGQTALNAPHLCQACGGRL